MSKTPKAAAKAAATPKKPADQAGDVTPSVTPNNPESESGKAEMGAAVTPTQPPAADDATASASHEPESGDGAGAATAAPPAADGSVNPEAQAARTYVACWPLRANGKRYATGKPVPELSETETASLLKLGAIRVR